MPRRIRAAARLGAVLVPPATAGEGSPRWRLRFPPGLHPAPAADAGPDRPFRSRFGREHRPFGTVHLGLESGIGSGSPTLDRVGGGMPLLFDVRPHRLADRGR
ncbi:hypothetical protein [Tautonia sociabilis]|uniref:Uncharacterized protein n=1 Tax=Tautonia sociabilis TaxID=2080755 RepID=A0A432MCA6_9BACT|nr:hypothetical protein [Tautonia sociabilis]RUL81754.1 hypothetical protein TsocGM_24645 [Tautonia sociabilis]